MSSLGAPRFICIHGHFYQPPRENPWLEMVELEDSASPYHDWNERITAECYGPNSAARLLDRDGKVRGLVNNYAFISFNVGPTLLAWIERNAPEVAQSLLDAHRESMEAHLGHSNAMAQPYAHTILPLDSPEDIRRQVRWGIASYQRFFGHRPEGMWLPETAVDLKTLEVLAQEGIRFTVLAPHQAKRIKPLEASEWMHVQQDLDTTRPYECRLPSGRSIAIFFYHGPISRAVAFEGLLNDGETFYRRLLSVFDEKRPEAQLAHIATDGESYGHHHRFGEMALAYVIDRVLADPMVALTNYGEFLELFPPRWQVEVMENTSWSCAHGIERWRSDCGCRIGSDARYHQRWRGPLRDALTWLKKSLDAIFEEKGRRLFKDPWEALDRYIWVILEEPGEGTRDFWESEKRPQVNADQMSEGLSLLEMERHALLMFTSCGWFFDEISGIEGTQILKYAARALQLAKRLGQDLEENFLSLLEQAPSNDPQLRNGRGLWEKRVRKAIVEPSRAVAHYAIGAVLGAPEKFREFPALRMRAESIKTYPTGNTSLTLGKVQVLQTRTSEKYDAIFGAIHFGGLDVVCLQKPFVEESQWEEINAQAKVVSVGGSAGDAYLWLREKFPEPIFRLADLFEDQRRKLVHLLLEDRIGDYLRAMEALAEPDLAVLEQIAAMGIAVPDPLVVAASVHVDTKIERALENVESNLALLEPIRNLIERSIRWGYKPKWERWSRLLSQRLEAHLEDLQRTSREPEEILEDSEALLRASGILGFSLNLWKAQNLFIRACERNWYSFGKALPVAEAVATSMNLRLDLLPWRRRPERPGG